MIKAIALDVDGVILGTLKGVNSPLPSQRVTNYIKLLNNNGIPISLISGKGSFALKKIAKHLELNGLHVTDGGGVVVDIDSDKAVYSKLIESNLVLDMMKIADPNKYFWELYTTQGWNVQMNVNNHARDKHQASSLVVAPKEFEDIKDFVMSEEGFTKAMILLDKSQKEFLQNSLSVFADRAVLTWASTPAMEPIDMVIITAKNVSKNSGIKQLAKALNVDTSEILGVGDTIMDWDFMQECGYIGVMGNATQELIEKVKIFDQSKVFQGAHVDDNGLIDILEHFKSEMIVTE